MHVPLIKPDLPAFGNVEAQFREILDNGRISNFGKYVSDFEAAAGRYVDAETVTLSSGTMGLLFTLQALGVERGAKVILPSFTFMATAQAIRYAGGVPIFAEVGDDLTISVEDLQALLEKHPDVAAVIGVHVYGLPCRVHDIAQIVDTASARRGRKISLIYDAAHAFGSGVDDRKIGSFGDAEVFSLSVTKALVSVEGGMVTSRDKELIERLKKMRNYGIESNYDATLPGLNGKMSEFHAIVGLENLKDMEARMEQRQALATRYLSLIREKTHFETVPCPEWVRHTWKDLTVLVPESLAAKRDQIIASLKEREIETRAYFFPAVHEQRLFKQFADRPLPRTESMSRRVITLPFFTSISDAQIEHVVGALADAERRFA